MAVRSKVYPWRLIMATFLHGSLLHIGFNMWVLMDIGPQIEELYGSAVIFLSTSSLVSERIYSAVSSVISALEDPARCSD